MEASFATLTDKTVRNELLLFATENSNLIENKEKLWSQVDGLSINNQKKSELKQALETFYDERAVESKPNLEKFNLKIDNEWLLVLTSHWWYETKIDLEVSDFSEIRS